MPVCRTSTRRSGLLPEVPAVRLVFKDFPSSRFIRGPYSALAGRCAYEQDPQVFWKLYDNLYDNQDLISHHAWTSGDYASQPDEDQRLQACMTSPEQRQL